MERSGISVVYADWICGVRARRCSGAKSAPFGHVSVCPSSVNRLKYSGSFNGSNTDPSNSFSKSACPSVPSLNFNHTRWPSRYFASSICRNFIIRGVEWVRGVSAAPQAPNRAEALLYLFHTIPRPLSALSWEVASDDTCGNLHCDLILAILRVKVWRCMIAVIHPDDDPEKSGNFRHIGKLGDHGGTFNSFRRSWSMVTQ